MIVAIWPHGGAAVQRFQRFRLGKNAMLQVVKHVPREHRFHRIHHSCAANVKSSASLTLLGTCEPEATGAATVRYSHVSTIALSSRMFLQAIKGCSRSATSMKAMAVVRCLPHPRRGISRSVTAGTSPVDLPDYAVEMPTSCVRFGEGVTAEVGMDFANMGAKNVCLVTDPTVVDLESVKIAIESLNRSGIPHKVYKDVAVEPTDSSYRDIMEFSRQNNFDAFLAVGGGSVIDSAKIANLFGADTEATLLDYTNAPVGKAKPVTCQLKPLVAVPTTSGTGSETTGVAIYDYVERGLKTGISSKALRPTLGIIDPLNCVTMPRNVTVYAGFDVLCHALESYTAVEFTSRKPRPANPSLRPPYQGHNPISGVWCLQGIELMAKNLKQAANHPDDIHARSQMHLASTMAGIGFGTAGVHIPHALSYGLAGCNKRFHAEDYPTHKPLVPHGLSVVLTAPAAFEFTAPHCPERHLKAAEILGANTTTAKLADAGSILGDTIRQFLYDLDVEDGLEGILYTREDIPAIVAASLPQDRLLRMAPCEVGADDISQILENSLTNYK